MHVETQIQVFSIHHLISPQITVQLFCLHIYYLLLDSLTVQIYMPLIFSFSFARGNLSVFEQVSGKEMRKDRCALWLG